MNNNSNDNVTIRSEDWERLMQTLQATPVSVDTAIGRVKVTPGNIMKLADAVSRQPNSPAPQQQTIQKRPDGKIVMPFAFYPAHILPENNRLLLLICRKPTGETLKYVGRYSPLDGYTGVLVDTDNIFSYPVTPPPVLWAYLDEQFPF